MITVLFVILGFLYLASLIVLVHGVRTAPLVNDAGRGVPPMRGETVQVSEQRRNLSAP